VGAESLAIGTLVLFVGMVLVINAWAVIDTRSTLEAAAREYLRAYTEADDPAGALRAGDAALSDVLADRTELAQRVRVEAPDAARFGPCAPAGVVVSVTVEAIRMPIVSGFGSHEVTVRAVELIDAHQEVTVGPLHDPEATACAG